MEESKNYNLITTIMFISGIIVMASLYTALPLTATFAEDFHVPESIDFKRCFILINIFNQLSILWNDF